MRRARFLIRAELFIAVAAALLVGVWFFAFPVSFMPDPLFWGRPRWPAHFLTWVAYVGVIVGLIATVWLSRIDPEGGERTWRYRDY